MISTLLRQLIAWAHTPTPEEGQDMVEYALLLGLMALVAAVTIRVVGTAIADVWNVVVAALTLS
mgnify:CR=1 FL=1